MDELGGRPGNGGEPSSGGAPSDGGRVDQGGAAEDGGSEPGLGGAVTSGAPGDGGAQGEGGAAPEQGGAPGAGGAGPGLACLDNPPAECPFCETPNENEVAKCQEYLSCFAENDCLPPDSCTMSNDGICGVNTIGGGMSPHDAAVETAECACP